MVQNSDRTRHLEGEGSGTDIGAVVDVAVSGDVATGHATSAFQSAEVGELLQPMLAAVVRLAGATAATVRLIHVDGTVGPPVASVGSAGYAAGLPWCAACDQAWNINAECAVSKVRGHADHRVVRTVTQVCRHVGAVPLEHRGKPVGMLGLRFDAPFVLAPELTAVLKAVGDLLGVALENARLAAANLRVTLMNERQMMANEVHDSLAQALTYMRMRMSLLSDAIGQGDEARACRYWSDVDNALTNAHRRLRELITYFRSRMDPQGLVHALRETANGFFDRTGVALEFDNQVPDFCLPADREVEAYHIVQEALSNVCRHAHARRVDLCLHRSGADYAIEVVDDGIGLGAVPDVTEADDPGHYGVAIMRERARRLGGSLTLDAAPGGGTRVRLLFPVEVLPAGMRP